MAEVIRRHPDIGPDGVAHQRVKILGMMSRQQRLHRGSHAVHDCPQVAGLVFGRPLKFFEGGHNCPALRVAENHHQPTVTYASAVHVAWVEVDPATGQVRLLRYAVAHDCGRVINPMIVEGQIHGGVAQGVGGALLEEMVYDDQGQLLTGTLMDYLVPTAMEVPPIETAHLEYPSPRNPLGVKGIGEGGAISPPAAIANAVEDALAPWNARVTRTPLGPSVVLDLIRRATRS